MPLSPAAAVKGGEAGSQHERLESQDQKTGLNNGILHLIPLVRVWDCSCPPPPPSLPLPARLERDWRLNGAMGPRRCLTLEGEDLLFLPDSYNEHWKKQRKARSFTGKQDFQRSAFHNSCVRFSQFHFF